MELILGKTLFEKFCDWFKSPVIKKVFNPLNLKVGSMISIDELDYRDLSLEVVNITESKNSLLNFTYTDYFIKSKLSDEPVSFKLRVVPNEETFNILLLKLSHEHGYNEDLFNLLNDYKDKENILELNFEDKKDTFWRVRDVKTSYNIENAVIDKNNLNLKNLEEIPKISVEYWDFWREDLDEISKPYNEFLFVEMQKDNGWFSFWRGFELDTQNVIKL